MNKIIVAAAICCVLICVCYFSSVAAINTRFYNNGINIVNTYMEGVCSDGDSN